MNPQTVSMKNFSAIKIGGEGKIVFIEDKEELKEVIVCAKSGGLRVYIIGEGTNTYFGDDLSKFLFIKFQNKNISFEEKSDDVFVMADAGVSLDNLISVCVDKNFYGLENLSFIPGTVGASPVQNVGAYGVEIKDVFESLIAFDLDKEEFINLNKEDCKFGYRDSIFKKEKNKYLICEVKFKLSKIKKFNLDYSPLNTLDKEKITIQEFRDFIIKVRKEKLPDYKVYPNTGSFFKNPIINFEQGKILQEKFPNIKLIESKDGFKIPSAWLIENIAQMKGQRIGDVGTWPNQPLVIINYGKTTVEELENFTSLIIEKIKKETGIILEREVNFVN